MQILPYNIFILENEIADLDMQLFELEVLEPIDEYYALNEETVARYTQAAWAKLPGAQKASALKHAEKGGAARVTTTKGGDKIIKKYSKGVVDRAKKIKADKLAKAKKLANLKKAGKIGAAVAGVAGAGLLIKKLMTRKANLKSQKAGADDNKKVRIDRQVQAIDKQIARKKAA